jgi:hypothetical protein
VVAAAARAVHGVVDDALAERLAAGDVAELELDAVALGDRRDHLAAAGERRALSLPSAPVATNSIEALKPFPAASVHAL